MLCRYCSWSFIVSPLMCKYLIILNWFWYPVYDKISNFIFLYVWSIYWRLFPIVWLLVPSLVIMMSKCLSSLPTLFHSAMCLPLVSYCFDTVALYYILKPGVVRPLALFFLFKITLSLNNDFWFIKSNFFLVLWIKIDNLVEILNFSGPSLWMATPTFDILSVTVLLSVPLVQFPAFERNLPVLNWDSHDFCKFLFS